MKVTEDEFFKIKEKLTDFINITIITPSMAPLININDTVTIKRIEPNDIEPYDIVVFWQSNKLICHFFIKSQNGHYITRGLNNRNYDDEIEEKHLLGVVIKPKVGSIKKFFLKFLLR